MSANSTEYVHIIGMYIHMYFVSRTTPLHNTAFKLFLSCIILNEHTVLVTVHVRVFCLTLTAAVSLYVSIFSPEVMQRGRLAGKAYSVTSAYLLKHICTA